MLKPSSPNHMTAREREEYEQEKEMAKLQAEYTLKLKSLELEATKLDIKWQQLYKLPIMIVNLPLTVLLGIAYICSVFTKKDLGDRFWEHLKK